MPKGGAVRGRPNNRLRFPFPRYIAEVHTGYFLGLPPTLALEREADAAAFAALSASLRLEHLLFNAGRDMSVCGVGYILVWLERDRGLQACRCSPLDCFAVRSAAAGSPLLGTVRLFRDKGGGTGGVLYTRDALRPFAWDRERIRLEPPVDNPLLALSLIPFANNCQGGGGFEMVTGLVDAYNLLLSGAMDDMQSVANAFLALYGMQGTTQGDIDEANRTRVLSLAEGGGPNLW